MVPQECQDISHTAFTLLPLPTGHLGNIKIEPMNHVDISPPILPSTPNRPSYVIFHRSVRFQFIQIYGFEEVFYKKTKYPIRLVFCIYLEMQKDFFF